ncbi:MAG: phosphate-starvation-inducible PsiE family protein [Desulfomonile sp.]|nr:phosphate-starvation-inducible PsiE family protein [Desulfomonile sp.]
MLEKGKLADAVKKFERVVVSSLIVMMGLVVVLATVELGWILIKDIMTPPAFLLEIEELLELFGLFLLVLIGIELFETIQTYYLERAIRVEVVVTVAIIAISRKVIILDYKTLSSFTFLDVGGVIMALAIAYYLIKKAGRGHSAPSKTEP